MRISPVHPRLSAIVLLATAVAACDRQEALDFREIAPPAFEGADVVIRPVGDRGTVELGVGQSLAVEMKSHFDWREASPPVHLRQLTKLGAPADRAGRDQGAMGGDNWQVFVYRAVEPGEETLHFVEAREWEPDNITGRHDLTIRILPASD